LVGFGLEIAGPGLVLVFVLNFIVTVFTAMAYAELSSAFPDTGGGYLWVKEGMPQPFGFLAGWMSWFGHCIVTSFYVFGFGKGVMWILEANEVAIPFDADLLVKAMAVAVCLIFIMINYRGTKETGKSSIYITMVLIAIISTFIISGIIYIIQSPGAHGGDVTSVISNPIPNGWGSILIAMGFTFIVFEGYEIISQCSEECIDPLKNVPKASWMCIVISTIIFVLVAIVCVGVVDWTTIGHTIAGDDVVAEVAKITIPKYGILLVATGVILGTLAAINSTLFSSSRVSFAMGRDGALPDSFGKLNKKNNTPSTAIFTSGAIVIAMTLFLPIEDIAASADIMFLLLFLFVNLAVITLRYKRPDIKRHYMMPFFPWIPIVGLGTKFVLAIGLWWEFPMAWVIAVVWIEIGLMAFYLYGGKEKIEKIERGEHPDAIAERKDQRKKDKEYKILVPVTGEEEKNLVKFAALVARVENAEIHLIKVIEMDRGVPLDSMSFKELAPHIKVVDKLKKILDREGIKCKSKVLISRLASDAIQDTINEEDINLTIIGWRGQNKTGHIFGHNIDALVQKANCDVVVFKSQELSKEVKKILVVSTPMWHSSYATSYAVLIAKQDYSHITIFSASADDAGKAEEEKYADKLCQICQIHEVEYTKKVVESKSVEDAIVEEAAEHDLVVFGAAGEWNLK
ncbi:MAG: amino acid permease, partial [Thermoplasmata archaeon]|nr:amino acid permease [Thermoplasmata archaeon]